MVWSGLTETNRLHTLGFLDHAVEYLEVVERWFFPSSLANDGDHLFLNRSQHLGVAGQIDQDLGHEVGSRVDSRHGHDELRNGRVVVAAVGFALKPLNRIVKLDLVAAGTLLASLFGNGRDDSTGFLDVGSCAAARGEEPVNDEPRGIEPHAQLFCSAHGVDGVFARYFEPFFVAAELVA